MLDEVVYSSSVDHSQQPSNAQGTKYRILLPSMSRPAQVRRWMLPSLEAVQVA